MYRRPVSKALGWFGWALWAVLSGACGYALQGRGTGSLSPDVRVIAIPPIEGVLPRAEVQQKLTQHVIQAFVARTHRRIQADPAGADAVLKLEVQTFQVTPVGWTAQGQAQTFQVLIGLRVRFYRVPGESVLFEHPNWVFRSQFSVGGASGDPYTDPEVQAIDELGRMLAQALVSAILEAF